MNQVEVEERMYLGGIERARASMEQNEEHGEAGRNPYAATIYRDFVAPLASIIEDDRVPKGPGRFAAHVGMLRDLDANTLAYLTVRVTLSALMGPPITIRGLAYQIGMTVHQELVLDKFADQSPDLYHTLARDFGRRRSKSVRHRMTVFKMQAKASGIDVPEWGVGHRDTVGHYLLFRLRDLGMVHMESTALVAGKRGGKRISPDVSLMPDVMDTIDNIKGLFEVSRPLYGPCVEPPLDWTRVDFGGFHTERMRRRHRYVVKAPAACRELFRDRPIPMVLQGVNALQRTAWAINTQVLDAITATVRAGVEFGELVAEVSPNPKPIKPDWLDMDPGKDARTVEQEASFRAWKRDMAEWYTQQKLRGAKWGRFNAAVRTAQLFRDEHSLFFVYFLDSRGRAYPLTYGVSPQGSDIQKALLHFSEGKPLSDEAAVDWFLINGANRWGFDKAPLAERAQWARDRKALICAMADDPVNNTEWREADKPLQFLAWCFEYADWVRNPATFVSHIPVGLDGSCNGLQHFSAMLRDTVGGEATNLTSLPIMQDIYAKVALATIKRMKADQSGDPLVASWLEHGITRTVVKRAVMTTPYGVTKKSAVRYVIEDYLNPNEVFEKADRFKAATVLMGHAWPAIGDVVTKSREAMDWLHRAAKHIIKARGDTEEGVISWETPSGFIASQAYYEINSQQIDCKLFDNVRVRLSVVSEGNDPSPTRHSSGLAPNFVHSMDASHMHMVAAQAQALGIDALAMVHDDFGTHAADTQKFFRLIRMVFVQMYTDRDPLTEFHEQYPETEAPPPKGDLELEEVLWSDFFFS